jgi:mannitol-1-phosphate 5-dehydrogenase
LKKILLFGAGKIGRSFIGQLFSQGGFEVVFVDVFKKLIEAINSNGSYPVIIKSDTGNENIIIKNVRGIHLSDHEKILQEIQSVSYIATAVGQANLPGIIPIIAQGIKNKLDRPFNSPTDIIIAENLRNAASYFEEKLLHYLTPEQIKGNIGLIETSIGKMVPIMTGADLEEDITQVFAEPYNTLILDKKGFLNPLPDIPGLSPKENMEAWVDRKSFIHNLGHAAVVYYGFLKHPELKFIYELLSDPEIKNFARSTMIQSGNILLKKYPGEFSEKDLLDHIDDLLMRFQNKSLGDTVFRVGMDLNRKMSSTDRLAGAIHLGLKHDMPYGKILYALICGMYFRAVDENGNLFPGDKQFAFNLSKNGLKDILQNICGFDTGIHSDVFILSENYNIDVLSRFNI